MSWHTMMDFEPPLVGCVVSNRNFTFNILKATKECVINIPTVEMAPKVVGCGNTSGRDVDKFKVFRVTQAAASQVNAPLIEECYANLECRVVDTRMVAKYNLFVLEVIQAWIDPSRKHPRTIHHVEQGVFLVAGKKLKLPSKMKDDSVRLRNAANHFRGFLLVANPERDVSLGNHTDNST
ncbi:MAG: flavin reductase family protein [Candidatus Binataceae bacterium]